MDVPKQTKKPFFAKGSASLYIMGGICVSFIIAFNYVPLAGWIIAFFDYKPGMNFSQMTWNEFKSFKFLFSSAGVFQPLKNTLIFSFIGLGLAWLTPVVAILLSEMNSKKAKSLVQTIITFPNFISWVLVYSLAFALFSQTEGIVNLFLMRNGLINKPLNPMGNADIVYTFQTTLNLWKNVGFGCIIYLAALTGIDPELFDAADVDGAGRFQKMIHIKLPGILPTFFILLILGIGQLLNNGFEQYFIFRNGIVQDKIMVLDLYVYLQGIYMNNYSIATATSIVKTLVSILLLTSANLISKRVRGVSIL